MSLNLQTLVRLAGALLLAATQTALADPVTYAGKLGKADIVVEFTDDPAAPEIPLAGRYFYKAKGVDIPLQAKSQGGRIFELGEEGPCSEGKCGDGKPAPIDAVWRLSSRDRGKTLRGSWNGSKSLEITLKRVGSRPASEQFPANPYGLFNFSHSAFFANDFPITRASSPYDYLRLDAPLQESEQSGWPDASYRYVVDPRTEFRMPRIVSVAGGSPVDAANELLRNRHWRASRAALACMSRVYAGFSEEGRFEEGAGGSLGGYEDSTAEVTALTPKLMGWTESGSIYCGGAHPTNYSTTYVMDVRRGALLGLEDVFSDTAGGVPGEGLVAFVRRHRAKPIAAPDIDYEAECGTEGLIAEYLSAALKRTDAGLNLVFGLQGLPHAIQACGDDLLELPVEEIVPLFKPAFAALVSER